MTAILGHVTRTEDGAYKGPLRTLNVRADIEVVPVRDKASPAYPDFRVLASGVDIGAGVDGAAGRGRQRQHQEERAHAHRLAGPAGARLGPRAYARPMGR